MKTRYEKVRHENVLWCVGSEATYLSRGASRRDDSNKLRLKPLSLSVLFSLFLFLFLTLSSTVPLSLNGLLLVVNWDQSHILVAAEVAAGVLAFSSG